MRLGRPEQHGASVSRKQRLRSQSRAAAEVAGQARRGVRETSALHHDAAASFSARAAADFSVREKTALLTVLLIIYAVAGTWGQFDFGDMMGYYTMAADAALQGHLYIAYTPDKVNLIDMIPYHGHYYLQWGPFPILFHLAARIAGLNLSDRVASLLAGLFAAWLFLEITIELRRRYFPDIPKALCRWFAFAYALATPAALVAWRGTVYNESIAIAAACVLASLAAFLRYQRQPVGQWLLLSGACIGAAFLTRATVVLYAVPFFLAIAAANWLSRRALRTALVHLAVFSLPVAAAGVAQMAYNQARFGSPLDFGIQYKPESKTEGFQTFSLRRVPENLGHYILSLPKASADFPWLDHTGWEPRVYTTFAESMSSMLLASPFLLLAVFLRRLWLPGSAYSRDLKLGAALAAGSGLMMFGAMLCFASASRRYMQDWTPMLTVAAFLGAATLSAKTLRRWAAPACFAVALSALLHAHVAFYESFRSPTPDLNVTRAFIAAAPAIRQIHGGAQLDREEAMARNDWATVLLKQRHYREALEQFAQARQLMPDSAAIERNWRLAARLAEGRSGPSTNASAGSRP